ncbi:MAG TPA: ssl1498 family light-harvesting-like protein [Leptolyngbyaceae cyanobacterium]
MYTTTDERGILNNYATEPQMYLADFPSYEQQSRYKVQAVFSALLVSVLVLISLAVS